MYKYIYKKDRKGDRWPLQSNLKSYLYKLYGTPKQNNCEYQRLTNQVDLAHDWFVIGSSSS